MLQRPTDALAFEDRAIHPARGEAVADAAQFAPTPLAERFWYSGSWNEPTFAGDRHVFEHVFHPAGAPE